MHVSISLVSGATRVMYVLFVCMKFGIAVSGSDGEIEGKKSEMPPTKYLSSIKSI